MDAQQVKNTFGFDVSDLSEASVEEVAGTGELVFDRDDYLDLEQFKWMVKDLTAKCKGKRPSCKSLSVNGKVIQDRMEKYLSARGESSSALKEALKSPRHYLIYKNEKQLQEDRSHFTLGTFIHSAFLEPSKFSKVKVLPEGGNKSSKAGIQTLIKFYWEILGRPQTQLADAGMNDLKDILLDLENCAANQGFTFIDPSMKQIVDILRVSYMTYGGGIIPRLVANGRTEVSMYGKDDSTGLKVKIRPDCMLLEEQIGANIILSVKSTSATSIEGYMRDAAKYRYDLAEGMYLQVASEITGRKFTGTLMLVAQTVMPYQCFLLWLDAEDLACGRYKYHQALDVVKQAKKRDCWPGFETYAEDDASGIIQVRFPAWTRMELKPQYIPGNTVMD